MSLFERLFGLHECPVECPYWFNCILHIPNVFLSTLPYVTNRLMFSEAVCFSSITAPKDYGFAAINVKPTQLTVEYWNDQAVGEDQSIDVCQTAKRYFRDPKNVNDFDWFCFISPHCWVGVLVVWTQNHYRQTAGMWRRHSAWQVVPPS